MFYTIEQPRLVGTGRLYLPVVGCGWLTDDLKTPPPSARANRTATVRATPLDTRGEGIYIPLTIFFQNKAAPSGECKRERTEAKIAEDGVCMDELYAEYTEQEHRIRERLALVDAEEESARYEALKWCLDNVRYSRAAMRRWVRGEGIDGKRIPSSGDRR